MALDVLLIAYVVISWLLLLYALNFYYLLLRSFFRRKPPRTSLLNPLPRVTVQLPIYNERYVARRLIDAVCRLAYPREKLEIQVLDDSTDVTKAICREVVQRYSEKGFSIFHLTRGSRKGNKAGALQYGLKRARGEFVAIFDADFIPPKDFLTTALRYFSSPNVGLVQGMWSHLNLNSSRLTQAEGLEIDLHFNVEQKGRSMTELFLNFNGTAGLWRRKCIEESGGWHENLTEDLDLSYRAQMKGWKIIFADDLLCQAELPSQVQAAMRQRYRWANGAIQCARKYLPRILRSKLPLTTKVQAFFQLTRHLVYPLLVVQFILLPIMIRSGYQLNAAAGFLLQLSLLGYVLALRSTYGRGWSEKVVSYFFLVLLGSGMAITNIKAVISALSGRKVPFLRTPKFGIVGRGYWKGKSYVLGFTNWVIADIALALYGLFSIILVFMFSKNLLLISQILLMVIGFVYVASLTVLHSARIK